MGKSTAKEYVQRETGVTFADVAGEDEAEESLQEIDSTAEALISMTADKAVSRKKNVIFFIYVMTYPPHS